MRKVLVIGAGPAGLVAAYQLIQKSDIKPIIIEECDQVGGLSKTVNCAGNRMDLGGHRFFSKSERVNKLWQSILMPENDLGQGDFLTRKRVSRIFFLGKFFDYPVALNKNTILNLGPRRIFKIFISYLRIKIRPIKEEKSLEDFFINRFGRELYSTFFKDYTEKLWGVKCSAIDPEWGQQRIKSFSISGAIKHILQNSRFFSLFFKKKKVETTLIDSFLYPKFGPGQMYEEMAKKIQAGGGEIYLKHKLIAINHDNNKIKSVKIKNLTNGDVFEKEVDVLFSSMPVKDLIFSLQPTPNKEILDIADGLFYRDFITVGVLLKKLKIKNKKKGKNFNDLIPDNWLYIQEKGVHIGRLQVFNNWSPFLVKGDNVWLGLEYFGNFGDTLFSQNDAEFKKMAISELVKIGIIAEEDVLDSFIIRVPKAYPAYFGKYKQFPQIRSFVDSIDNLFLIGRNGMHRYNNMDHSILTGLVAADNIINNIKDKSALWQINTENEYHEEK